jgi:uncharacterized membrane protein
VLTLHNIDLKPPYTQRLCCCSCNGELLPYLLLLLTSSCNCFTLCGVAGATAADWVTSSTNSPRCRTPHNVYSTHTASAAVTWSCCYVQLTYALRCCRCCSSCALGLHRQPTLLHTHTTPLQLAAELLFSLLLLLQHSSPTHNSTACTAIKASLALLLPLLLLLQITSSINKFTPCGAAGAATAVRAGPSLTAHAAPHTHNAIAFAAVTWLCYVRCCCCCRSCVAHMICRCVCSCQSLPGAASSSAAATAAAVAAADN